MDVCLLYTDVKTNRQLEVKAQALRLLGGYVLEAHSRTGWDLLADRNAGDSDWASPFKEMRLRPLHIFIEESEPLIVRGLRADGTYRAESAGVGVTFSFDGEGRLEVYIDGNKDFSFRHIPTSDRFCEQGQGFIFDQIVLGPMAFFNSTPIVIPPTSLPGDRLRVSALAD